MKRLLNSLVCAALALSAASITPLEAVANSPQARGIAASGQLAKHPNTVLLTFLTQDCGDCLPDDLKQQAIQQITTSLRQQTLINPMEQVGQMMNSLGGMFSPGAMMKQAVSPTTMLSGALGVGAGPSAQQMQSAQQQAQDMRNMLLDPWVRGLDAADNLRLAGYTEPAAAFYSGCLKSLSTVAAGPYGDDWLSDACIDGALQMGPEIAGQIFTEIWDAPYPDFGISLAALAGKDAEMQPFPAIQAIAARALGRLAATGELQAKQYKAVIDELIGLAESKNLDLVAGTGVIRGLAATADPRAQPVLKKLARRGKPEGLRPIATRALAAAYRDEWAVKKLRKEMGKGGGLGGLVKKAKSIAPWTDQGQTSAVNYAQAAGVEEDPEYLAASVLLHIGDEEAFEWTNEQLERRVPPEGSTDHRPDLVRDLVDTGGDKARQILAERVAAGHPNEWLEAWMRIGLYELGDHSQLPKLAALAFKSDWDFGRNTVGSWYKRLKPLLWEGAKVAAGMPADTQRMARMVAGFALAERDRYRARVDERTRRTAQFRWRLADAMATSNQADALPLILSLLEFDDESVRISAARALIGRSDEGAPAALAQALKFDYGEEDGVSRNPEIHAALLRDLVTRFPNHPQTLAALEDNDNLSSASMAFMVYAARAGITAAAP